MYIIAAQQHNLEMIQSSSFFRLFPNNNINRYEYTKPVSATMYRRDNEEIVAVESG
ncbi:hypothetical protein ccbrp13_34680 [Ktedonobacteria bacterium brp13]|nr:hypothetical protein ccbrp13_34680 [Ktedonobacteria bacterium brp13]